MSPASNLSLAHVAAALVLVAIAAAVSWWQRTGQAEDIGIAVLRSFLQLTAVGFVIRAIFESDSRAFVFVLLAAMVAFATWTARRRAAGVPEGLVPIALGLTVGASATIGLVVAVGIFDVEARALVPVGGMVIGNAMTATAVALNRLGDEMRRGALEVEAALALGATARQASAPLVRRSLGSGLIPLVDQTKTTGVVFFPGTMVGMLLAGAEPFDAVRLQLILLYVLLGAVAMSSLIAVSLAQRRFFTPAQQLRELPPV
ncbi:MAG TPA: iron export ABC transporter permease subunit FetB [Solirubrobacteraceae bacterium]